MPNNFSHTNASFDFLKGSSDFLNIIIHNIPSCVIFLDNRTIEIGFSLWKYIEDTGKNFLLLISAERCDVMETQVELFNKLANGNLSYFKKSDKRM